MKILIIEDEPELLKSMTGYLRSEEYICEQATDITTALNKTESNEYDCILLDIGLPDGNGLQIIRELKKNHKHEGVIIISAKNSLDDKIEGLNMGADDYLAKPFHLSELSARVSAIIRRKAFSGNEELIFREIKLDTTAKQVSINEKPIDLTRKEFQMLLYLLSNKNKVISKNAIARHLWGDDMDTNEGFDFIYTHIKNLRKKMLEAGAGDYIKAVYGMGYKFTDQ